MGFSDDFIRSVEILLLDAGFPSEAKEESAVVRIVQILTNFCVFLTILCIFSTHFCVSLTVLFV
jgi:hypothetical protein